MSLGDVLGLITGNVAANKAIQSLEDIQRDIGRDTAALQTTLTDTAQFKPFTVTTGQGRITTDGGLTLPTSPIETGLYNQAQQGLAGLGQTTDTSGLAQQALTGASTQLGANTGAFASGLGGMYGAMGEQQIASAGAPSNLAGLQSQFAQQGMQGSAGSLGGLTGQLQQAASGALGQATPTAQSVYEQIRAMQTPEEERQRMALENRLAAQGRLGVTTSAFGGTPEQLALEKAQAEARNQASLQALQTADALASSQQQRAAQLAQLGMSAEQIDSQLATEGLSRQQSSAQLAGQLAQTGAGIEAQQQQLGQGLLGLGLQAQELGGRLSTQDIARAQSLFGLGQQATTLPYQEEALQLANIQAQLQAAGIPQAQQLQALAPALQLSGQQTSQQLGLLSALAQLGQADIAGQVDIGQAMGAIDQERIKAAGQAVSGLAQSIGEIF